MKDFGIIHRLGNLDVKWRTGSWSDLFLKVIRMRDDIIDGVRQPSRIHTYSRAAANAFDRQLSYYYNILSAH